MEKPFVAKELLGDSLVHLAPIESSDLELIRTWRNRDEIRNWFNDSRIIEASQQRNWYQSYVENPRDLMFLVRRAKDLKAVGTVALYRIDVQARCAEFGRLMIAEEKNGGLGYAAAYRACKIAFEGLSMRTLDLEVRSSNIAARRIYERIGFSAEASMAGDMIAMHLSPQFLKPSK